MGSYFHGSGHFNLAQIGQELFQTLQTGLIQAPKAGQLFKLGDFGLKPWSTHKMRQDGQLENIYQVFTLFWLTTGDPGSPARIHRAENRSPRGPSSSDGSVAGLEI